MQAYQLDQKLERKTFASVGCSEAENKEVCTITGVTKGKEKLPKDIIQQRTPATTQWPRNRKSHLFAISNQTFCVWLYFCSIRVTWFPLDYPITNIMLTRWLTLERRCCLISQKRQVGVGYWRAQSTLRERNYICSRGFFFNYYTFF